MDRHVLLPPLWDFPRLTAWAKSHEASVHFISGGWRLCPPYDATLATGIRCRLPIPRVLI